MDLTILASTNLSLNDFVRVTKSMSFKEYCKMLPNTFPIKLLSLTGKYKSFTKRYSFDEGLLFAAFEKKFVEVVSCRDPSTGLFYDIPVNDQDFVVTPDLPSNVQNMDIRVGDLTSMNPLPLIICAKEPFSDTKGHKVDAGTHLFINKRNKRGEIVSTTNTGSKIIIGPQTAGKFSLAYSDTSIPLCQAVKHISLPFSCSVLTCGNYDTNLVYLCLEKVFKTEALFGIMTNKQGSKVGDFRTKILVPSTLDLKIAVVETESKLMEDICKYTTLALYQPEEELTDKNEYTSLTLNPSFETSKYYSLSMKQSSYSVTCQRSSETSHLNPIKVPSSRPHNKTKNLKIGKSSSPPWKRDPTPVGCQKQSGCSSLEYTQVSPESAKKHPIRSRVLPKFPFEECKTSSISNCLQVSSSASELDTVSLVYEKMADYEPISDSDSTCKDVPTLVSTQSSYRHLNSSDGLTNLEKPEDARSVEYDSLDSQSEHEDDLYEYVAPATVDGLLVNIQAVTPLSGHNQSKNIQMHHMYMNDRTTLFKASSIPKDVTTQSEPHLSSKPRIGSTTPADHAKTTGTPKTGYATMMDLEHPKDPELAANETSPPWPGVIKGQDCSWEKLEEVYNLPEYSAIKQSEDVKNHECSSVVSEEMEDEYEYASHLPSETTGDKFEYDSASADCDIHSNYDSDYEDMDELFRTNNIAKLRSLGIQDVQNLLEAIALSQYKETFKEEQVDGKLLVYLDDTMLCELGVDETTHRMELLKLIQGERSVTL